MPTRAKLKVAVRSCAALEDVTIEQMFTLFDAYYERADRARFLDDLAGKQHVILLTMPDTGQVKGFSTVRVLTQQDVGVPGRFVYSGDTVVDKAYWGGKALHMGFLRVLMTLRYSHPRTPLYWLLTAKGYRTYLLMTHYLADAYPRHDRPTPPAMEQLRHHLGTMRYGDKYDPATGVVRHDGVLDRLRGGIADVSQEELVDPDIRFFQRANPGHADGDELLCLGHVHKLDPARVLPKFLAQRWRR
ncbi:MAG: hypothetical protein ACI9WU_003795 [Myxococcota bacterium]